MWRMVTPGIIADGHSRSLSLVSSFLLFILITGTAVTGDSLDSDRQVLLNLKSYLESRNPTNRGVYTEWKMEKQDVCQWPGISCMPQGSRVTGINLSDSTISGALFSNFSALTQLTFLDLSKNTIEGSIPDDLSRCQNLKHLNLSNNILDGELTISGLSNLEVLDLSVNRIAGDVRSTFPLLCNSLVVANLSTNNFTGRIDDIFNGCRYLKYVDFSSNGFSGEIWAGFGRLVQFSVSENHHLSGNISATMFRGNCTLQVLDLSENEFVGEFPGQVSNCHNLNVLNLWGNNFTGNIPPEIGQLPLTLLNLTRNKFSGQIPQEIGNLKCLQTLDLSYNNFSENFPKSLNELSEMSEFHADKTWQILERAIHQIYNQDASSLSFEELYRNAYNMVLHKFGEKLYTGFIATMTAHLKEKSKLIEAAQGGSFLEELNKKWNEHNKALEMIRDILMYMDRTYIESTKKPHVHPMGLSLWRDNVVHSPKIHTRLLNTLLDMVQKERTGEVIDRGLMRNATKMFMDLGKSVYQEDFEKPFMDASSEFYKVESQELIDSCDCGDYLKKAEKRLTEEIDRVGHYLDAKSEDKITSVVEKEMIANHMQRLVHMENSGLVNMLLNDKYEDLGRMYNLFRRVTNGVATVRDVMTSHLREMGKQLVTDPEKSKDPVEFVQRLLDERDKYDKVISTAFGNDKTFQNALNSSFEYFINLNARSPEFISLFVDDKLRKGLKGIADVDVEVILDKVMMLFRYLQEKDVFEKYYKQHLAKRLLSGKTVSDDAERSLIVKLKTECGYQFTSKSETLPLFSLIS